MGMSPQQFLEKFPDTDLEQNTNCLVDRGCPECGARNQFIMPMNVSCVLEDNGADVEHGGGNNWEYDESTRCKCGECGWKGVWADTLVEGLEQEIGLRRDHQAAGDKA